jgi:hypothetical protein
MSLVASRMFMSDNERCWEGRPDPEQTTWGLTASLMAAAPNSYIHTFHMIIMKLHSE